MKIQEITEMTNKYTAYVLDPASRAQLAERFPPKYKDFIGNHVTVQFGVPADAEAPKSGVVAKVVGYLDSGDGLEVLVVSIDGTTDRPDKSTYHITWSLDRSKYSPSDSNDLLRKSRYTLIRSIPITVTPGVL